MTHISLCIANFINSVMRQKVVFIELSSDSTLLSVVGKNQVLLKDSVAYKYKGVYYVLTDDVMEVMRLMTSLDAWFVVDMKSLCAETEPIFMACNNKIVIGSLNPWCEREYYKFVEEKILNKIDINEIVFFNNTKNIKKKRSQHFKRLYGRTVETIPIIEDPFSLKEEEFDSIMNMVL